MSVSLKSPTTQAGRCEEQVQLRRMRWVSLLEGSTLIALVFVAVPLKHIFGYPAATAILGPIHGAAFLLYVWMLSQTISAGDWAKREIVRMIAAAFIPFGAFVNERALKRKEDAMAVTA
jgi:integral membrane protein